MGDPTSMRPLEAASSFTHARSRPDHVVMRRRRLVSTRAPATIGSPSRLTTSTCASSQGVTRASPAVTVASTPTVSPASTTTCSPGRTSDAGTIIVCSPRTTRTLTSSSARRRSRAWTTRARPRATRCSMAIPAAHVRPARTAIEAIWASFTRAPQHAANTAPAAGARVTSGWGSARSRRERAKCATSAAKLARTRGNRATSPDGPSRLRAGTSAPSATPTASRPGSVRSVRAARLRDAKDCDGARDDTGCRTGTSAGSSSEATTACTCASPTATSGGLAVATSSSGGRPCARRYSCLQSDRQK